MVRKDLYSLIYNDLANHKGDFPVTIASEKYEDQGFTNSEVLDAFDYVLKQGFAEGMVDYASNLIVESFHEQ